MPDAKTPTAATNPAEKKVTPASKIPGRPKNVTPDAKINKKSAPLPELVIVADDFGVSEQRNLGILHAMEAGVVTLASVMVNGAAAEAGIQLARERGFLGRLGLHLNLTEGRPLLGAAEVPSLLLDGGDAPLLFRDDELVSRIVPDLVLRGMAIAWRTANEESGA